MIGQTVSHYPLEADATKRHKILEKLGEVRLSAGGGGETSSDKSTCRRG